MDSLRNMTTAHDLLLATEARLSSALEVKRSDPEFLANLPAVAARVSGMVATPLAGFGVPRALGSSYSGGQRGDAARIDTASCSNEISAQEQRCMVGDIEKWVLPSEGVCITVVWIRRPKNSTIARHGSTSEHITPRSRPAIVVLSARTESANGSDISNALWHELSQPNASKQHPKNQQVSKLWFPE